MRDVLYRVLIIPSFQLVSQSYCVLTAAALVFPRRRLKIIIDVGVINVSRDACSQCILLVMVLNFILRIEFFKNHLVILIFIRSSID